MYSTHTIVWTDHLDRPNTVEVDDVKVLAGGALELKWPFGEVLDHKAGERVYRTIIAPGYWKQVDVVG